MKDNNRLIFLVLLAIALLSNLSGFRDDFFTDDPGLYASISKQLIFHKNFFFLYSYGKDWLDKPHFPFWAAWLSFKIFGIHTWSYRLPALIFFFVSLIYTYLLALKFYTREIAFAAVLILLTSLHAMMSNTDVRAEPYLMGMIVGAIYHIAKLRERLRFTDLVLAALFTAMAIMTKGIFVIGAIYGALAGELIFKKRFKELFAFKWVLLGLLTIIFIFPELYALYTQFDLHPEKVVFGKQHVSGIKFFLWDSQFGRFAGSGPITRKSSSIFFYVHTLLWAFAPWCLLFYYALYKNIRSIIKGIRLEEYYTLSGSLLLLILFSVSGFQLPFYTNILFPLFAIITARFCFGESSVPEYRFKLVAQWVFIVLFPIAVVLIQLFLKPADYVTPLILLLAFLTAIGWYIRQKEPRVLKVFWLNCSVIILVNFYLNMVVYPVISAYKAEIQAAAVVNQHQYDNYRVGVFANRDNNFQFYTNKPVDLISSTQFNAFTQAGQKVAAYANQFSIDLLRQQQIPFKIVRTFENYPRENVLPQFINHSTRNSTLEKVYLISN
jgi:4-amino-4-deoxy-L-arabinose transferase-like glycosyltransferase